MPRKGHAYPVTEEWQGWVRGRIKELEDAGEIDGQNGLARKAGISKSSLSTTLKKGAKWSTVMPELHKALGWPAPLRCPPIHVLQLVDAFLRMPEIQQGIELERLRGRVDASDVERDRRGARRPSREGS